MGRITGDDEVIRKRSEWLLPLSFLVVIFALSVGFLIYYLAPPTNLFANQIRPTANSDSVYLAVGGQTFRIPANYLPYASARGGGARSEIALFALLPDFSGWSNWKAEEFSSNTPDSRVVFLSLHSEKTDLKEADKLTRIYMDYVRDPGGTAGPYGLRQFAFREDSGYRDEDLLVGDGPVVLRCVRPSPSVPSPNCLREKLIAKGVSLSYRFKRAHLDQWHNIVRKADELIVGFQKSAP